MTEPLSIGTATSPNLLFNRLSGELQLLQKEGYPFDIDIDKIGEYTFLGCHVSAEDEECSGPLLKHYVANCLADLIVNEWETRIIKKIVRENYYYYNEEEKQQILNKAREILNPPSMNTYHKEQRKEKVMTKILEYLDVNMELILEGFIKFRLKDYQNELENVVNNAVDEFLLEKEYQEFIRLLKYFVDIQEPRIQKLKIVFKQNGRFCLLDENGQPVNNEYMEGLVVDLLDNEINYDDLLISALITMAPRELELHLEKDVSIGDTIKTIKNVFGKRVSECKGCQFCRPAGE